MFKLIKNKCKDFIWNREENSEFIELFDEAFSLYKSYVEKSSRRKKVKNSDFAHYLNFFAYREFGFRTFFSEKDIRRLKMPKKGVHTKHSFEIICALLKYVEKYNSTALDTHKIAQYCYEMDRNVVFMYNVLQHPEAIKETERDRILAKIELQEGRINYYIESKVVR